MSRASIDDGGVNPTEEASAMNDVIAKENFSKNAAADASGGNAHEAMSKFASEHYKKPEGTDESKSKLSKALDDKFKSTIQKDASTEGDTKDVPKNAVEPKQDGDAKSSKTIDHSKDSSGSSAEKCLPNLKLFDSGKSFDATPNAPELKKNPALDSQKDGPSKYPHMLHPESAEIPHVKGL